MIKTVIMGGQLWDKTRFIKKNLVIDKGVMEVIDAAENICANTFGLFIDGTDKWIVPGLINAHCHLVLNSSPTAMRDIVQTSEQQSLIDCEKNAKKMLCGGFTTIRDCGSLGVGILKLRDSLKADKQKGPRLVSCGRALKAVNGHSFGIETDGKEKIITRCHEYIHQGVDFIKLMATGGLIDDPLNIGFNEEEMTAAVNVAKKYGLKTAAHAHSRKGILNAANAEVSTIEHGTSLDNELIELMLEKDIALVPTFAPYIMIGSKGAEGGMPERIVEGAKRILEEKNKAFENAYRQRVNIVFGSDAGSPFVAHDDVVTEMYGMKHAGMSTRDIIRSATDNAAKALGLEQVTGSIESGKDGNILLLKSNPLDNLSAYQEIELIIREGEIIKNEISL